MGSEAVQTPAQTQTTTGASADQGAAAAAGAAASEANAASSGQSAGAQGAPAQTQQQQQGQAQGAEAAKPVVPEKYELKLPEKSQLEASDVQEIEALAKEQGLSNEQAQKLLEQRNQDFAKFQERQTAKLEADKVKWFEESKADKEIGGAAFVENSEFAKRAFDQFASPLLKEVFVKTGLANHPEWVRTFARIGRQMGSGKIVMPGAQAGAGEIDAAAVLFPTSTKNQ